MGIKRLEDFNHDVEVHKNVLSSMPINNAKNLKLYKEKVQELKEEYSVYRDQLYAEIELRSKKYLSMKPSNKIEQINKELLGFKELALFNPINTPFEKLGLDNILYSLNHYFKNDLEVVNNDIKRVFEIFRAAGIELTSNDFAYSNYAKKYIFELQSDDDLERMKDIFEDIHWKCPDVILHIAISIRILFNKNIKKFEEYLKLRQKDVIDTDLGYEGYLIKQENLSKELIFLQNYDDAAIVSKFMNGELILNDYSKINVDKSYSKFLGDNVELSIAKKKIKDFENLLSNLDEYKNYLKYTYILEDVKKKYAERTTHLGATEKIQKEISALEGELVKLASDINSGTTKGFWIFKKKVEVEQLGLTLNEKIKELDKKYDEYDDEFIYEMMNKHLSETSSVYDVFKFVLSYKGYLRKCIKSLDENVTINFVKQNVKEFEKFLNNPTLNVLKNVKFLTDTDVAVVIADHYKLLNIDIDREDIEEENIDTMMKNLNIIINNYYLENTGLDIDFILELFESKKIVEKKEKAN